MRFATFGQFWPYYLQQHARRGTRIAHYAGTTLVVLLPLLATATGRWRLLLSLPAAGYGFAWAGHALFEKNRPATFRYPLWSLRADFLMWHHFLKGRLDRDLEGAGVRPDGTIDPRRRLVP